MELVLPLFELVCLIMSKIMNMRKLSPVTDLRFKDVNEKGRWNYFEKVNRKTK